MTWVNPLHAAALAALVMTLGTLPARAQSGDGSGDASGWARIGGPPPPPPEGFQIRNVGEIRWVFPDVASDEVELLAPEAERAWRLLENDLGVDVDDAIEIRIARGPDEMRELAPPRRPPPSYATGVAYTDLGLIILSLTAPETWQTPELEPLLVHELSHIALRRAVEGRPLPRWFVEGVAIHQSGERSLARMERLVDATLSDSLIPLSELDARFPERTFDVSLAYAQSADIVEYLRANDSQSPLRFSRLIRNLREGKTFSESLAAAYGATPDDLEDAWRAGLEDRSSAVPTLVAGSTFWVIAAVLVVMAWRRRRRRAKEKLDRWEHEERATQAAAALAEQRALPGQPSERALLVSDVPGRREPGVPTVEIDGQNHTLH